MKKIFVLFFCLFTVLFITGCGNKKVITVDTFSKKMEENGYIIYDITDQYSSYDYMTKVIVAQKEDSSYQIEFFQLKDEDNTKMLFRMNKKNLEQEKEKSSSSSFSFTSRGNFSKYSVTTKEKYLLVSRVENTIIHLDVPKDKKKEINTIIRKLGY